MESYRILEHPADLGIEAEGATLCEAFANAARALMSIILDPAGIELCEERKVEIHAVDTEQLLVKWLSEILYLYDGLGFIGKEFDIRQMNDTHLLAVVRGEMFDGKKHRTRLDVKAVTYHQLTIEEGKQGARVRVFLDI